LFHLSGNLFEWCWDIHEPELPHGPQLNPHGPDEGESRTRRGGAWDSPPEYCMISHRFANAATYAGYEAGFRVCRRAP